MVESPRNSRDATRRELREFAVALLHIDAIAVALGGLFSRPFGTEMWIVGIGVAGYVTMCFAILIGTDLAVESVHEWWLTRRHRAGC